MDNRAWSDRIIRRLDPSFRHRWEVYEELLLAHMPPAAVWLDIGCGDNSAVAEMGGRVAQAVGVDPVIPAQRGRGALVCARLAELPVRSGSADLVTLRFVVEHLEDVRRDFAEVGRVLRPGGRLVVLTTNLRSPWIWLPRLLPFAFKKRLIRRLYKVEDSDILPTFHRLNTVERMRAGAGGLELERHWYLQDANYVRRWLFLPFFLWHVGTRPRRLQWLRTNILSVFVKRT